MSESASAELHAAFEQPFWALGRDGGRDRRNVVVSWPAVPVEVLRAAGLAPVFSHGAGTPTPAADRVLEPGLFPSRLRQLVEAALTGRLTQVAAVVLPRSSDADYKCFLYLRELERLGVAPALPPVLLFDLLHADEADAHAYNADRVRVLSARLCGLTGRQLQPADLRRAIALGNRARAAARRLGALRGGAPLITGSEAMRVLGAFWQVDPERYAALAADAAEAAARRAPLAGLRVLLAGAPVDSPALHEAIEAEDAVVVAELGPFGSCGVSPDVDVAGDPFAALARHYARESLDARAPVAQLLRRFDAALGTVQAAVISLPPDDASFGWDYPRLRDALARRSVPHTVLSGDPAFGATAADRERIRALLATARGRPEARCG